MDGVDSTFRESSARKRRRDSSHEDVFARVRPPTVNVRKQSGWLPVERWENRTRGRHTNVGRTPVTRGGCNHVSVVPWLPWLDVGPTRRIGPLVLVSFSLSFSLSRANVGRSESVLLCTSLSAFAAPTLALCFSLSRVIPLEAVVHKWGCRVSGLWSGHGTSFLFLPRSRPTFARYFSLLSFSYSIATASLDRCASSFISLLLYVVRSFFSGLWNLYNKARKQTSIGANVKCIEALRG